MKKLSSAALLGLATLLVISYVLKKLNIVFVVKLEFAQLLVLIAISIIIVYFFLNMVLKKLNS